MTKFEKIKEIIRKYQNEADELFKNYKQKEERARKRYTSEVFKEEFIHGTWVEMAGRSWANADLAVQEINDVFDEIEKEFNMWVMKPINTDVLQTLSCIRDFGLKLSLQELKVIEGNVLDSYFGTRIFAGLAKKNGYDVKVAEMKEYLEDLDITRKNIELAIRAYAGREPEFLGRDLLDAWKVNGSDYGEYQDYHLQIAANFLKNDSQLDRLEIMWQKAKAPIQYTLLEQEAEKLKESLEKIIDRNGEINKKKADDLIKQEPDIVSKLDSMSGYKNRELIYNYYVSTNPHLKRNVPVNESKILPSIEQAAEYAKKSEKVNMDILNQY